MRIRRGCGCPALVFALVDLIMVIAVIISLVRGAEGAKIWGVLLYLIVFLGNTAVCLVIAVAAFRGGIQAPGSSGATTAAESEFEGEDTVDDSTPEDES